MYNFVFQILTENSNVLNDEKNWGDLVLAKSWDTALIRVNVAATYDTDPLVDSLLSLYPHAIGEESISIVPVEDVDWITKVRTVGY